MRSIIIAIILGLSVLFVADAKADFVTDNVAGDLFAQSSVTIHFGGNGGSGVSPMMAAWYPDPDPFPPDVVPVDPIPVPEPATLAIIGLGIAGAGFAARRRVKKQD